MQEDSFDLKDKYGVYAEHIESVDNKYIIDTFISNIFYEDLSFYDKMRVKRRLNSFSRLEENTLLIEASIYCHKLIDKWDYINKDEDSKRLEYILLSLRCLLTDYFTYRIDLEELNNKLKKII